MWWWCGGVKVEHDCPLYEGDGRGTREGVGDGPLCGGGGDVALGGDGDGPVCDGEGRGAHEVCARDFFLSISPSFTTAVAPPGITDCR